jgi:hypothetical protein
MTDAGSFRRSARFSGWFGTGALLPATKAGRPVSREGPSHSRTFFNQHYRHRAAFRAAVWRGPEVVSTPAAQSLPGPVIFGLPQLDHVTDKSLDLF